MRVKEAIEAFLRYTDKPMIASHTAVLEGLKQACKDKLIGIGRGLTLNNLQRQWCGEDVTLDANEEGLWIIPPFEPQPVSIGSSDRVPTPCPNLIDDIPSDEQDSSTTTAIDISAPSTEQMMRLMISGSVSLENWSEIFRCFVSPAVRLNLKRLRLGIHFELEAQDSQPLDPNDPTVKAMKEAARQLGLEFDEG